MKKAGSNAGKMTDFFALLIDVVATVINTLGVFPFVTLRSPMQREDCLTSKAILYPKNRFSSQRSDSTV